MGVPATLGRAGFMFREFSLRVAARQEDGKLVRLLRTMASSLPDSGSWRFSLAWDTNRNEDVGWLTALEPSPSLAVLNILQLRNWNLNPPPLQHLPHAPAVPVPSSPTPTPSLVSSRAPSPPPLTSPKALITMPTAQAIGSASQGSCPPGVEQTPCPVCHKLMTFKGLKVHMKRIHPDVQTAESVRSVAKKSNAGPTSSKTLSPNLPPGPASSKGKKSSPDSPMEVMKPALPLMDDKLDKKPILPLAQTTFIPQNSNCTIKFNFEGRKLKLKTVAKKPMLKALTEFSKYRGLKLEELKFQVQGEEGEVEGSKQAGEYGGKMILATKI